MTLTTDRPIVTSGDATNQVLDSESPALEPRTTNTVSEGSVEPAGTENRLTPFKIHVLSNLCSTGPGCPDSPDTPLEAESDEGGTEDDKPV